MITFKNLPDINGKTVFLRLDLNVPVVYGQVSDAYRIEKALPTIKELQSRGAKLVIASHIDESPDNPKPNLAPIYQYLEKIFPGNIVFIQNYFPEDIAPQLSNQQPGQIALLENLRKYPEEKANDEKFAKHLAACAQYYVDDAFAVAHRKHASIIGIPKLLPHFVGPLIENEIEHLSVAFNPTHPFVCILGGAKFDTKLPLVQKFLTLADKVFVGGALSNDLFKAKGFETGTSLLSDGVEVKDLLGSEKLLIPIDVVVKREEGNTIIPPNEVKPNDLIVDSGPQTLAMLKTHIDSASLILWNGPLGNFEIGFIEGTKNLAAMITESHAKTIVGGGDTLEALPLEVKAKFSFVSTGGGAMLDFLANETLPGIDALK